MVRVHPGLPLLHGSQSGQACRRRLETGRTRHCGLWSMSTGFRTFMASGHEQAHRSNGRRPPAAQCVEWVASIVAMQRAFNSQSTGQNRGDSPFLMEAEPDKRAGTASKADRAPVAHGEHLLRLPPFPAGLAEQSCPRLVNELTPVQLRQPAPSLSPVAQPAERPTLTREVDGANPSGAATQGCERGKRAVRSVADRRIDIAKKAGRSRHDAPFS